MRRARPSHKVKRVRKNHNRGNSRNLNIIKDDMSSTSDDDIPKLASNTNSVETPNLLEDVESNSSSLEEEIVINGNDWNASTPPLQKSEKVSSPHRRGTARGKRILKRRVRGPRKGRVKIDVMSDEERNESQDDDENSLSAQGNEQPSNNIKNTHKSHSSTENNQNDQLIDDFTLQSSQDQIQIPSYQSQDHQDQSQSDINQNQSQSQDQIHQNQSQDQIQNSYVPMAGIISPSLLAMNPPTVINCDTPEDAAWQDYSITRIKNKLTHLHISLHHSTGIKLTAERESSEYGTVYHIYNNLHKSLGFVHKTDDFRYTTITNLKKMRDDREGEVLGVYLPKGSLDRYVAIPVTGKEHFPISDRLTCSNMAKEQSKHPLFRIMISSPTRYDLHLCSQLCDKKSVKNTILLNNGVPVFVLYKQNEELIQMRFREPLTMYQAFGLSISIIVNK